MEEDTNQYVLEVLRELNLTEYEIRAYMTLLRMGAVTAEQLSDSASIPLPRVYDTITSLQRKGFVLTSKTRPKKFKPIDASRALKAYMSSRKKEMHRGLNELEKKADRIAKSLSKIVPAKAEEEEAWNVWVAESRAQRTRLFEDYEKSVAKEICIFSGDLSWIKEEVNILKSLKRRKISIKILVKAPENKHVRENIRLARTLGAKIKTGYPGTIRGHIIDGKNATLVSKIARFGTTNPEAGLPGSDDLYKYQMINVNNQAIVSVLSENFGFWWNKLK